MSEFFAYLQLGFQHIADVNGYDHILFIVALCAMYQAQDWKRLLWLVTAFTLGHSFTLALSTLNIFSLPSSIVEFLIPVTIFLTAAFNIATLQRSSKASFTEAATNQQERIKYATAALFGLIHGMGFSTYLKSLLGRDQNIVLQLLAFNMGLEAGQILIVCVTLALTLVIVRFAGFARRDWALVLSGAAAGVAVTLMLKTFPF
jgi:hydrogenase/urease accessory protein HupE